MILKTAPPFVFVVVVLAGSLISCSSSREVKKHRYAELRKEQTFEYGFDSVWNGIEKVLKNHRIVDRDPDEVSPLELKNLEERELETDWIYARSNDKFITYEVNGFPRKKYLQIRFKYEIVARSVIGGTHVVVELQEEVERLSEDGRPDGYEEAEEPDSSRPNRLLQDIKLALLSSAR